MHLPKLRNRSQKSDPPLQMFKWKPAVYKQQTLNFDLYILKLLYVTNFLNCYLTCPELLILLKPVVGKCCSNNIVTSQNLKANAKLYY